MLEGVLGTEGGKSDTLKAIAAGALAGALAVGAIIKLRNVLGKPKDLKIIYFKIHGKARPIRAACKIGGINFTNTFVDKGNWEKVKPHMPFGQVPCIELSDGQLVSQSNAILRFVGKYSNLYPSDPYKALKVDEFIDACEAGLQLLMPSLLEKDLDKKIKMRKELIKADAPFRKWLTNLQKLFIRQDGPYATGRQMTIADLILVGIEFNIKTGFLDGIPADFLKLYPEFEKHSEDMEAMTCWDMEYEEPEAQNPAQAV